MPGKLVGDTVVIEEESEASQIYSKGFFGYPQSGGSLHLDLLEALHLLEGDRLEVFADGVKIDFAADDSCCCHAHRSRDPVHRLSGS